MSLKDLIFAGTTPFHREDCAAGAREDVVSPPPINLPQLTYNRWLAQWPAKPRAKAPGLLMPSLAPAGAGYSRELPRGMRLNGVVAE